MDVSRVLASVGALGIAAMTHAAGAPLAAFGQLPTLSDLEISPDGQRYAVVVTTAATRQVQIRSIEGNTFLTGTETGTAKVRGLAWADPGHLLVTVSKTTRIIGLEGDKREWSQLIGYDLATKRWRGMINPGEQAMHVIVGGPTALTIKGKPMLFAPGIYFPGSQGVVAMFRVDLNSGYTDRAETGNEDTNDFLMGNDGRVAARADYSARAGEWSLYVRAPGQSGMRRVQKVVAPIDTPDLVALTADGKGVLVRMLEDNEWRTHAVSLADGTLSPALANHDGGLIVDSATRTVIGSVSNKLGGYDYSFLDPADQAAWKKVERAFKGQVVQLESWSSDRKRIIVSVDGSESGYAYFKVDLVTRHADWLGNVYRDIESGTTGTRTGFTYAAADGTDIPAYLSLPPGRPAKALPLVVLPHGGPATHDNAGFDWWAQALASRGYAVLQPQFRGSTGFGGEHRNAGYGQWGRKMQSDLSDGVRALAKAGTIDPKRVCITGASYGGYAALAGVTLEQGVYRCAVSLAGPADLRRMLAQDASRAGGTHNDTIRYWQRFMGASGPSDRALDAISPAMLAAKVTVPVLLIHGKDDTVVEYSQSELMAAALRRAGKPVEFVTLKGEDHWLSRGETRQQMLAATVAFLEKHNPPDVTVVR